jgi:antitoxin (DNA-binding transcriptional repressor) of toxin-antitoxin stability system
MKRVPVTEFKSHCLRLLEEARATGEPLEILKRGRLLATVLPAPTRESYQPGMFKDVVQIVGDIEVTPGDLGVKWDALE